VVFHGFNSYCKGQVHGELFASHIQEVTGMHAECVEIDADFDDTTGAWNASVFNDFPKYTEKACEALRNNPNFNNGQEFNLVGLSQGSLVSRYVIEECPDLKVRNLFTLGGPHRGVGEIPFCHEGDWCMGLNYLADNFSEKPELQHQVNPASYFRGVSDLDAYMRVSIFLPYINNEKDYKEQRKEQMLKLNHAVFAMTTGDEVIYPKDSAIFAELQWDGSVLHRHDTEIWKKDLLGLKTMEDEGRATFLTKDGIHIEFTNDWFDENILPIFQS